MDADAEVVRYRTMLRREFLRRVRSSTVIGMSAKTSHLLPPDSLPIEDVTSDMLLRYAVRVHMEELLEDYHRYINSADAEDSDLPPNLAEIRAVAAFVTDSDFDNGDDAIDAMTDSMVTSLLKNGREERERYVDRVLRGFIIGYSFMDNDEFNRWSNLRAPYELHPDLYSDSYND